MTDVKNKIDEADQRGKSFAGRGKNPETLINGKFGEWHVTCEDGKR